MIVRPIIDFNEENPEINLRTLPGLPAVRHKFESDSVWAVNAALAADRPLLVRGEPGTGKSQLARAAAAALHWPLSYEVVTAQTECNDLLFAFDAVARLADAQVGAAKSRTKMRAASAESEAKAPKDPLDERNYLEPGRVWWSLNWESAQEHAEEFKHAGKKPDEPPKSDDPETTWKPGNGCVLLIDEIDKADSDVPNGLLEVLANGSFHVPYLNERISAMGQAPLVIFTTNEERDLPAAFLRRCLVLTLQLPKGDGLADWLVERGKVHFREQCSENILREAADMLVKDRSTAKQQGLPAPGQAEYLDLLRAVTALGERVPESRREAEHERILSKIAKFALKKAPSVSL